MKLTEVHGVALILRNVNLDYRLTGNLCDYFAVVTVHSCLRRITSSKVVSTRAVNGTGQSVLSPVESKQLAGAPVKVAKLKE